MLLVTSDQMRAFDKHTISTLCVPGIVLMELAGKAVAEAVARRQPRSVCVLCGKGNNGGDGWITARWLKHMGFDVQVCTLVEPDLLAGDAASAQQAAAAFGVSHTVWPNEGILAGADLIVDAMLGTGSGRAPDGNVLAAVTRVAELTAPVIAVDVPTGVDTSTGEVPGAAVQADETITMGYNKLGLMVTPGVLFAGRVEVADIGIEASSTEGVAQLATSAFVERLLPRRNPLSHKGTYGRVGILLGDMRGAAMLAGLGAARIGAGLVIIAGAAPGLGTAPHEFVLRDRDRHAEPFSDCTAVVIGPGLGSERTRVGAIVTSFGGPGVLDADALHPDELPNRLSGNWILTPHPKECARLLGWSVEAVNNRRVEAARKLSTARDAVVVLKGNRSIVATPGGGLWVNPTGGPALATGGTGDVLAGIIGGLLAQGLTVEEAAVAGAWVHGRAGDLAGEAMNVASVMASDVVDFISRAIPLHFDKDSEDARRAER